MSWVCAICKKDLIKTNEIYQCWSYHLPDIMNKYEFKPGQIVCLEGCSKKLEAEQVLINNERNRKNNITLFTDIFTDHDRLIEEERERVFDEILRELSGDGVVGVRQEGSTLVIERGWSTDFPWDRKVKNFFNRIVTWMLH